MRNTKKMAVIAGLLAIATSCLLIGCADDTTGKSEYDVYTSASVAYTITGESKVKAGEDYTFTVTPAAGYDATAMTVVVNGKTLTATDGKYTVSAVNDTLAIYVNGIVPAATEYVNVTFSGEHVDFTGDSKTEKGSDYTFTATAYDGYELTEVKNGNVALTAADGKYTVTADDNLNITATATAVLDFAAVAGDTPSKGGSVYVGEDNRTHIKITYNAEDRFMKNETECHYHEVGFGLTDKAWATAPNGANLAVITLKIDDWGTDVSDDITPVSGSGSSIWMVEDGIANLGFGNMKWPGFGPAEFPNGSLMTVELAKGGKFTVRNVDGFKATVVSTEFKTVSAAGETVSGVVNFAKDEFGNIYLRNAGAAKIKLNIALILGDACKGKKVNFVVTRLDDIQNKNNTFGPVAMKTAKGCSFNANLNEDGTIELDIDQMAGLSMIRVSLVTE